MRWILVCVLLGVLVFGSAARAAVFPVNTIIDNEDVNPGDGDCSNVETRCSLRAAIQEANALGGSHTITLGIRTYEIDTIGAAGEDAAAQGDLDVTSDITITGASTTGTIIEAGGDGLPQDRVFHVLLGGSLTLDRLTVRDGSAATSGSFQGGGILNEGVLELSRCLVTGNRANAGGGVLNHLGTLVVDECTFSDNEAQALGFTNAQGGAIFSQGVLNSVDVRRSTLSGNSAAQAGSALFLSGGDLLLENSTLSGNLDGQDAVTLQNANADLTNATIVDGDAWGVVLFSFDGSHAVAFENTIVANHGGGDCLISPSDPPVLTIVNSLSSDSSCGFDLEDSDPELGVLADNGGPTLTHLPLPGSPVIDAGAGGTVCPDVDQRGEDRPQGAACDIGAVEVPEPGALAAGVLGLGLAAWLAQRRA